MSPARKGSGRVRRPSVQWRKEAAPGRSTLAQSQRRCASRARPWRRPELICARGRESPGGKAWRAWRRDRPGCRAGSHDKSITRRPWPETGPNKKSRADSLRRDSGLHTFEILCEAGIRSVARKWCGQRSCTIVSPLPDARKIGSVFKSFPQRVSASYCRVWCYAISRKNSRTAVKTTQSSRRPLRGPTSASAIWFTAKCR